MKKNTASCKTGRLHKTLMVHERREMTALRTLTLCCVSQDSLNWALCRLLLLKYTFNRGSKNDAPALGLCQMRAASPVPQPTRSYRVRRRSCCLVHTYPKFHQPNFFHFPAFSNGLTDGGGNSMDNRPVYISHLSEFTKERVIVHEYINGIRPSPNNLRLRDSSPLKLPFKCQRHNFLDANDNKIKLYHIFQVILLNHL